MSGGPLQALLDPSQAAVAPSIRGPGPHLREPFLEPNLAPAEGW